MFYYMHLKKYSRFITLKKNVFKIFQDFLCFIQDLERHLCFIIDFHEIFMIFQDYLCFIKDLVLFMYSIH